MTNLTLTDVAFLTWSVHGRGSLPS